MDPYLEGDLWTSFHTQLGAQIARQLVPKLRPRYFALAEKRYVTVATGNGIESESARYPDVGVRRTRSKKRKGTSEEALAAPLVIPTVISEPVPHVWVEVRDVARERLVAAIEILSPTNKTSGREEYLEKRDEYLHGPAHLIEIDLTRQGQRVPVRKPLPTAPYFVFLSRVGRRPLMEVWPIAWDHALPSVPIPLLRGDSDVTLDLQEAFNQVYDQAGFDLAVHYDEEPDVPLPRELREWAQKVIRSFKKKRTSR
jgi:hypothetical protein